MNSHNYWPNYQAMGDCDVCGRVESDPIHRPQQPPPAAVLAIMQNQWFKNPERMKRLLEVTYKGDRPRFIKTFLFWSCLTGKRLRAAFGEDVCDRIVWEEASPHMGGHASAKFPPDPQHVAAVIREQRPGVILTFGKVAADAVPQALALLGNAAAGFTVIGCPHPAARHATVTAELRAAATQLAEIERKAVA